MVSPDFVNSLVQFEKIFGKTDDEVGQLGLTDAVLVIEATALARTLAVGDLVVYHVAG